MSWNFQEIEDSVQQEARYISDFQRLEAFRTKYLGRKGLLQEIYASLSILPHDQRPLVGKGANDLRNNISAIIWVILDRRLSVKENSPNLFALGLLSITCSNLLPAFAFALTTIPWLNSK